MIDSRVAPVEERRRRPAPHAVLVALRPRQWIKNLLVLAAPVFAGVIFDTGVIARSVVTFAAFCLVSSSIYLINDARDVVEDRAHPTKRFRPIAAGEVAVPFAYGLAAVLLVGSCLIGGLVSWSLLAVLASYAVINLAYCLWLKHEPVVDIAIIATGFVLRTVAGGAANHLALSQWFLLIASFGSLFMAAGKRYAEARLVGEGQSATRKSLARYSASYLRFVWSLAAGVLIMSYGLWSFQMQQEQHRAVPWATISMVPFVLAVLRYAVDVDAGRAGEPEDIALSDRLLQALAVLWLVLVGLSVYG